MNNTVSSGDSLVPSGDLCEVDDNNEKEIFAVPDSVSLKNERFRRKTAEYDCQTILSELEVRDVELYGIKCTVFRRLMEVEDQMKALIQLRNHETKQAELATGSLRSSILKLQKKHVKEKEEMKKELQELYTARERQFSEWNEILRRAEDEQEVLQTKVKQSELIINKQSEEIISLKKDLNESASRVAQVVQTNSDLSGNLTKIKVAHQKALSRAETNAKQLTDLRKHTEQISATNTQVEQTARTAIERRTAAESALTAVRHRADTLTARVGQLERELVTERVRSEEKTTQNTNELEKVKRRLLAVQSEAAKWKSSWQADKQMCADEVQKAKSLMEEAVVDRIKATEELNVLKQQHTKLRQLVDRIQSQATIEATNASSRLLVALSTSEESVTTALELKRCIDEKLQPELEATRERCHKAESLTKEWQCKFELLHAALEQCQAELKEDKSRMNEKQTSWEKETNLLREQLAQAQEEDRLKSVQLVKFEEQVKRQETELLELRQYRLDMKTSTDGELTQLITEQANLKATHDAMYSRLKTSQRMVSRLKTARDHAVGELAKIQAEFKGFRDSHNMALNQKVNELSLTKQKLVEMEQAAATTEIELKQLREAATAQSHEEKKESAHCISQLKQQLFIENRKSNHLEARLDELGNLVATTQSRLTCTQSARETCEKRLLDSESHVARLERELQQRVRQVERLELEVVRCKSAGDLCTAERNLSQDEDILMEQVVTRDRNVPMERKELMLQLDEADQLGVATADLCEANLCFEEQTADRERLLKELRQLRMQHERLQTDLRTQREQFKREKLQFSAEIGHLRSHVTGRSPTVIDTRGLCTEDEYKKNPQQLEEVNFENISDTTITVPQYSYHNTTACVDRAFSSTDCFDKNHNTYDGVTHESDYVNRYSTTTNCDSKNPQATYEKAQVSKPCTSNAASELEALIQQVTATLDNEQKWT